MYINLHIYNIQMLDLLSISLHEELSDMMMQGYRVMLMGIKLREIDG